MTPQKISVIEKTVELLDVFVSEFSFTRFLKDNAIRIFLYFKNIIRTMGDEKTVPGKRIETLIENAACLPMRAVMLEPVFGDSPGDSLRNISDEVTFGLRAERIGGMKEIADRIERVGIMAYPVFENDFIEIAAVVVNFVVGVVEPIAPEHSVIATQGIYGFIFAIGSFIGVPANRLEIRKKRIGFVGVVIDHKIAYFTYKIIKKSGGEMTYTRELKIALEAARAAGEIQMHRRLDRLNISIKDDASPVTEVDRLCEQVIRDILRRHFPADGFLGEETGEEKGSSGRKWIVDPLDGTRPYIRGIPTHSALIALEDGHDMAVGCMNLPALSEMYWASQGGGAFLNGNRLHVSTVSSLHDIMGCAIGFVGEQETSDAAKLLHLMRTWDYTYGFMDAYTYGSIAAGRIDACVNLLDKPWDCAAAVCIVREAGGRFSDIHGNGSVYHGSCILTNGLVHDAILKYFQ
jgi:histidinol-phosphatase